MFFCRNFPRQRTAFRQNPRASIFIIRTYSFGKRAGGKACELSDLCRPGLDNAHLYQCAAVISDSETVWDDSKGSTDYRNSSRKCAVLYGNPVAACSGGFAGRSRDNSGRKNVFLPDCSTLVGTAMLSGQKPGRNEACLDLLYVLCLSARRRLQRHF